jgi:hypothetical protein
MKFFKTWFGKVVAVASGFVAAVSTASADVATDITAAFTAAESNVTLAAGGLIGVVAIMTGIGFIISLLKR